MNPLPRGRVRRRDQHHEAAAELFAATDTVLRVPMLVVADVAHLAGKRLGTVDASLVTLAERLGETEVATFDRRDLGIVRPRHCERFTLLP